MNIYRKKKAYLREEEIEEGKEGGEGERKERWQKKGREAIDSFQDCWDEKT